MKSLTMSIGLLYTSERRVLQAVPFHRELCNASVCALWDFKCVRHSRTHHCLQALPNLVFRCWFSGYSMYCIGCHARSIWFSDFTFAGELHHRACCHVYLVASGYMGGRQQRQAVYVSGGTVSTAVCCSSVQQPFPGDRFLASMRREIRLSNYPSVFDGDLFRRLDAETCGCHDRIPSHARLFFHRT